MRSLSKVMKSAGQEQQVLPYDFFAGFQIEETQTAEEEALTEESFTADERTEQAEMLARRILNDAREQAELLREEAYEQGKREGEEEGLRQAYEEHRQILNEEIRRFQTNMADVIQSVTVEKEKILERYVDNLKEISLTVAEKIVQTSIRSSGDIVKRMILAATDKMTKKQWAKIYVTKCNTGISLSVDEEFLEALSKLSDNVKVITMDNGEEGTCIIELPDEIIDASVGTQLENIKDILNNARV